MTTHASTWSGSPTPGRAAPGTVIGGRYSLRTAIGHGGMGTVWRAADTVLRREVAVKEVVLPPGLAASDAASMYERTLREARAAASLSHPSVVQVFDVVTENGRPWIVMELLDARGLADMVIEDGPLAPRAVAKIGIALLGALEVAHAAGVLHRDVKPANVLITTDGRCVLTDFGVAKLPTDVQLTTPGMVLGSPHFISPERALGHRFGPPSDLFSLGVTMYTAVEGRPPFDKGDPLATMHAVVEEEPVPPQRCGPLRDVLYGLMEKNPDRRWDVARARAELRDLLAGSLAQNPTPQHVTDPYAVVAPQPSTTAWVQPQQPAAPAKPIGGRAMLHTGETPTSRGARRAAEPSPVDVPTGAHPSAVPTGAMRTVTPSASPAAAAGLLDQVKNAPKKLRLAVGAGLASVVLIATVAWAVLGGEDEQPPVNTGNGTPAPTTAASAAVPDGMQRVTFKGVTVLVPAGWKASKPKTASYIDYLDPADKERWLRINVYDGRSPRSELTGAENTFKTSSSKCVKDSYQRISLTDEKLGELDAAQLEFQCTPPGKDQRHAVWRIGLSGKTAYHVYLSTWESSFAQDRGIFDTAVGSFTLATT
ncbi:protein kinase [Catellatospora sp. KI3]|uniref:serine/threonine-protein kinase n=1 Tax=Catellatospora sp. KI3 TaxID=3041620 RepID=UPI0024829A57|nr:serine/threonine-protein kinase [Catellatospora sp. KI3]MDI1459945.1 protein kinase [Catellatospora sp. KI3]